VAGRDVGSAEAGAEARNAAAGCVSGESTSKYTTSRLLSDGRDSTADAGLELL
jgi:hypothetical protein